MIGFLKGIVHKAAGGRCILLSGGIGFKIAVLRTALASAAPGKELALWTHLAVREDSLDLYGFEHEEELRFFEMLLSVSGIGPKSALAILDIATIETLRTAISQGNAQYLTKVSGVGRKTAEKIVLELREKVGSGAADETQSLKGDEEALEAMRSLGYSSAEAREALKKVPRTVVKASDRLREALKGLGSRD
jgi:holliday junction DNA helicase RuvA